MKNHKFLIFSSCLLLLSLVFCLWSFGSREEIPEFDANSLAGLPTVDESYNYFGLAQEDLPFDCKIAGVPKSSLDGLECYFTNPSSNSVYLRLEVLDEEENILGETGLIKPGEYIKAVPGSYVSGSDINYRVISYTEDYYSLGSVILGTTVA